MTETQPLDVLATAYVTQRDALRAITRIACAGDEASQRRGDCDDVRRTLSEIVHAANAALAHT